MSNYKIELHENDCSYISLIRWAYQHSYQFEGDDFAHGTSLFWYPMGKMINQMYTVYAINLGNCLTAIMLIISGKVLCTFNFETGKWSWVLETNQYLLFECWIKLQFLLLKILHPLFSKTLIIFNHYFPNVHSCPKMFFNFVSSASIWHKLLGGTEWLKYGPK